jgi:hypothetical protein
MKKLFLSVAFLATAMSFGQSIYVPGGFSATGIGTSTVAGNVGIGTATPTQKLEVNGNIMGSDLFSSGTNGWVFHTPDDGRTNLFITPRIGSTTNYDWNKGLVVYNDGRLGINGGDSPAKLTVNEGSINVIPWTAKPNPMVGYWTENDKMTTAQTGLVNPGGAANYGMTYSNFGTTAAGLPGISLAGYYGVNFYTGASEKMRLNGNGNLGIGTTTPTEKLDIVGSSKISGKVGIGGVTTMTFPSTSPYASYNLFVKGGIASDEVRVALNASWADYVFAKDYNLKPLSEVEAFITANKHLPNVPSAAQVKEEGLALGDMSRIQQEKIEELTLYIIAQNKRIEALEAKMNTTK